MNAAFAPCRNHPDREAIGLCVRCRARVCGECTTKVDGINYCVSCLGTLGGAKAEREPTRATGALWSGASAAGFLGLLTALVWLLLEATLPGSSLP